MVGRNLSVAPELVPVPTAVPTTVSVAVRAPRMRVLVAVEVITVLSALVVEPTRSLELAARASSWFGTSPSR